MNYQSEPSPNLTVPEFGGDTDKKLDNKNLSGQERLQGKPPDKTPS